MAQTFEEIVAEEEARIASGTPIPQVSQDTERLPKLAQTEQRIADRPSILEQFKGAGEVTPFEQEAGDTTDSFSSGTGSFKSQAFKALTGTDIAGAKGLSNLAARGATTAFAAIDAAESGVASSLLAGMKGDVQDMPSEFIKGLKGEKNVDIGDLVRASGIGGIANEPIAITAGLIATIGAGNFATGNKIKQGLTFANQALKAAKKSKGEFFRDSSEMFVKGFDDAYTGMRHEFETLYNKIGNKAVTGQDAGLIREAADSLPTDVLNKLAKDQGPGFLNSIKKLSKFDPSSATFRANDMSVNTAKIIKDKISKTIPKNVWNGLTDGGANAVKFRKMKDSYFQLNDVIANNAGAQKDALLKLNSTYVKLNKFSDKIMPSLQGTKGLVSSKIKGIRSEANQDLLLQMTNFSDEFFKQGDEVLKGVDKMNKSLQYTQGVKDNLMKFGLVAGGAAAGTAAGTSSLKGLLQKAGGGSSGGGRPE